MNLTRFKAVVFLIFLGFLIVLIKDFRIQVLKSSYYKRLLLESITHTVQLSGYRGLIYDCKNRPLAVNYPSYSFFVDPYYFLKLNQHYSNSDYFKLKEKLFFQDIEKVLGVSEKQIERIIQNKSKDRFVVLKRRVSYKEYKALKDDPNFIPAFGFVKSFRRYYPDGEFSAHVIGFCFKDGKGAEGLENYYDRFLKPEKVKERVKYDAFKFIDRVIPKNGDNLKITLNQDVQDYLHVELEKCVKKHKADFGMAVIVNPYDGSVIAMDSYPYYNNNEYWKYSYDFIKNRAVSTVFEPGSVFKLLTMSAALDSGIFKGNELINCENGRWRLGRKVIHDVERFRTLSFQNVFVYSSNIGSAKIALKLGKKIFYRYLYRFGLGSKTGIDTVSEAKGIVKDIFRVGKLDLANMAFGQGIGVTLIQLADMYSVVANGGYRVKPHFIEEIFRDNETLYRYKPQRIRILKPSTIEKVKSILRKVVLYGTGKKAALKDYEVAGKTGTAQIAKNGKYVNEYVASFAGFAPYKNPKFVIVVSIFNPKKGGIYGGDVAAPLFAKLMEFVLHYYGVKQDNDLYLKK